ncbi:dynein light chain Tctex-type protein 2B-like isoform X1 [Haliotis rufescens]|uniref:dynein light chain Tctex-type protein 2B-like isoform X1 n=2 Tax=Haliotis rufescens TaxID=6454 RepID=UPI001EAFBFD0|nr:dynein light chain Tctex-type protein 2B-like isoform X1 [Haliotis rufescens]
MFRSYYNWGERWYVCTPIMDNLTAVTAGGSSLFDLTGKRLANAGSSITSFACEPNQDDIRPPRRVCYENTYQLEPPAKFRPDQVKPIIEKVLSINLSGKKYDPIECSLLCKCLSDDIKAKVKELNFKRYKIIAQVTIGEKKDQGVRVGSRFLWDSDRDNFASAEFDNRSLYAVGMVYGVYFE